ncbi:PREDICTED: polyadenylation and cleavage factor homolog 4-like isoform X2 [Lupinus angustifolius]|uniref:polyadenylation and cleavage factor homolog 4-like isoform X2 n=1 Tax=Lupinus angustifolius TaxID=3871 RepID=UPI00092F7655|nr:PREDICTED: polyadenylation and cleavage factor homolog 4-like isoform X2 [Lupinus angustifolius]
MTITTMTEVVSKPPSFLVSEFNSLLTDRVLHAPPSHEEQIVSHIYDSLLSQLTSNFKHVIIDLTVIAQQQKKHANIIANTICSRILKVPADQKLPTLYLLDSIVKNFGQQYVRYFSLRLSEVFCEVYRHVQPNMHSAMRYLFGTWSKVFPPSVLCKIESQLQFSDAVNNSQSSSINPLMASESTRATHGIHANPKYLRQMERSSAIMDTVGGERLESAGTLAKAPGREEELSEWQRKQYSVHGRKRLRTSMTYSDSLNNGQQHPSPKSLIDAYGTDKRQETSGNKALSIEWLDRNGVDNKVLATSWQNTQEEEFNWEEMSPTLVDRRRNNAFFKERPFIVATNANSSEQDTKKSLSSGSQHPAVDDSSVVAEHALSSSAYGCVSHGQMSGLQNQINQTLGSSQHFDAWKIGNHPSNSSQHLFNSRGSEMSLLKPPIGNIPNTHVNPYGSRPTMPSIVPGLKYNVEARPPAFPASFEMSNSVNEHATGPPRLNHIFPLQNHVRSQFAVNANNTIVSHDPHKSLFTHKQPSDSVDNKNISKGQHHQFPNQLPGLVSSNQQNHGQAPQLQFLSSQASAASQFSHGGTLQGHGAPISASVSNPLPTMKFPLPGQYITNNSLHLQGGALPRLPPSRPPAPSQIPHPNASPFVSSQQPTPAYSNLISSLMAQGLISMTNEPTRQDSVGTKFDPDILKVRHEVAISDLYDNLPRQCKTCGLRFKCQDDHRSHMDWHVTKNRMSKNRKQNPSRKWFVSRRMWLSGAEAMGKESVPGFSPTETSVEEKKDDEELAVLAEEDQNTCALCEEPFEKFYSDETEDWMYREAVYLNAPKGTTEGMERSQLGPIIHAKCKSEASMSTSLEGVCVSHSIFLLPNSSKSV